MKNLVLTFAGLLMCAVMFAVPVLEKDYLTIEETFVVPSSTEFFQSEISNDVVVQDYCRKCRIINGEEYCTEWKLCED